MIQAFWGNLALRVGTALVALPALLAAFFLGPPALGVAVVALAAGIGLFEFFGLMRARSVRPLRRTGLVLAGAMFLDVTYPEWYGAPFWPLAALLLLIVTLRRGADLAEAVPAAATTLLGATYLGALGGTIAALRILHPVADGASSTYWTAIVEEGASVDSANGHTRTYVFAICGGGGGALSTIVKVSTVQGPFGASGIVTTTATCPAGTILVGGGANTVPGNQSVGGQQPSPLHLVGSLPSDAAGNPVPRSGASPQS